LETCVAAARQLYPPGKEYEGLRTKLKENLAGLGISPELQAVVEKDARALDSQIEAARNIRETLAGLGIRGDGFSPVMRAMLEAPESSRREAALQCRRSVQAFQDARDRYTRYANATPAEEDSSTLLADAAAQAQQALARRTILKQWTAWLAVRKQAEQLGLGTFVEALQSGELPPEEAVARFRVAYARWWLPAAVDRCDALRTFQKFLHEDAIRDFRRLDDLARQTAAPWVRRAVFHGLPPSDQVPRKSELGLLRHQ